MSESTCPCGSREEYAACCRPYHAGTSYAPTAETLMRSRYCAYVKGEMKYLVQTLLPEKRPTFSLKAAKDWAEGAEWLGLEIIRARGGESDQRGEVEFVARFRMNGQSEEHHEISTFEKRNARWFFTEGRIIQKPGTTVSRNALCPCGSGKKFKRCCA